MNFHKIYSIRRYNDIYWDQIFIEKKTLKIIKITNSYKKYEQDTIL